MAELCTDETPAVSFSATVGFGAFVLATKERRLEREGVSVNVGGRALDLLICLVKGAGRIVSKAELREAAWPGIVVEEGSLRFHIASLRRILDKDGQEQSCIKTVAGRGYCFTSPLIKPGQPPSVRSTCVDPARMAPYPRAMIGRTEALLAAAAAFDEVRLLTLVGPAGIGKTTLALRLTHHMAPTFPQGVAFVDLSALSEPALICQTIATALGDRRVTGNSPDSLVRELRGRRLLLVLDGCEHMIGAVADLAENLLARLPDLAVLATSRESLRIDGEGVYRVFPLACPPVHAGLTLADIMRYPAAQLFIERVRSASIGHQLSSDDVPGIVEICRKLDGIPLALELAAGCVASCGAHHAAHLLESPVHLLWKGRRTAPPRHQTLGAALDWSYDLLSDAERIVLRRVSVFAGDFTLEAAQFLLGAEGMSSVAVTDLLDGLVAKSLIGMQESGSGPSHYRLLGTTAAYAFSRLSAAGEVGATLRRHADYIGRMILGSAQRPLQPEPAIGSRGDGPGNIHAALT
jgi:predicted ATPase/DNA-binding winged helix-turn-helix (wHTH) protein